MPDLDCRGLACPEPVLKTKAALSEMTSGRLTVLVDNLAAVGNVTRFAESQGCQVTMTPQGAAYTLILDKIGPATDIEPDIECRIPVPARPRLVVQLTSRFMGQGAEELGRILMKAFIKTLLETDNRPAAVVLYNSGVHLACQGSEHLEPMAVLAASGTRIMSCGTCLDYYHLKAELAVGIVTNMFEIVETLAGADRILTP